MPSIDRARYFLLEFFGLEVVHSSPLSSGKMIVEFGSQRLAHVRPIRKEVQGVRESQPVFIQGEQEIAGPASEQRSVIRATDAEDVGDGIHEVVRDNRWTCDRARS